MNSFKTISAITGCLALVAATSLAAQPIGALPGFDGPLGGLAFEHAGTARHEGSWDRSGGNGDARGVAPGQTLALLDFKGAGIIRRFWVTIAPNDNTIRCQAILRMYWDGETEPSVETPVGAFFGVGFGEQKDFISLPLNETSGGYNCYWPMPFHKSARWTITNLGPKRIDAFYYNIDFTSYEKLSEKLLPFHAEWRRENPTTAGKNYTILEATGRGQFVGTALFMQNLRGHGLGFLEGDEMVYVDGQATPAINGTGTEDYFSGGWYFDKGPYSAPYHGCIIKDTALGRISAYRWHIEEAIPFHKSIRFTIEHGNQNDTRADYSSVAYWYQTEPHQSFPPLPPADQLLPTVPTPPKKISGAIEGEQLVASANSTSGVVEFQDMSAFGDAWSNDGQLWWHGGEDGASLTMKLPVPAAGTFEVIGYFTKAPDYGIFQVLQDGRKIGPEVDGYASSVVPSGAVDLGRITLAAGENTLVVRIRGKAAASTNYLFGLDALVLKPVPASN
ncbi:MAG: glycoside hydrolase family 172 protein [Limisphaerales bacterium]